MRRWATALLGCLLVLVVAWSLVPAGRSPEPVGGQPGAGFAAVDPLGVVADESWRSTRPDLAPESGQPQVAQPIPTARRDAALVPRRYVQVGAWFRSEDGLPLTTARLTVTTTRDEPVGSGRANARGKAQAGCELFQAYAHETVRLLVHVEAPGFAQLVGRISAGYGETLVPLGAMVLPRERSVRGRLVDENGQPVAGASVHLRSQRTLTVSQRSSVASFTTPERVDVTAADGHFGFVGLGILAGAELEVERHRWVGWSGELDDDADGQFDLGDVIVRPPAVATSLAVRVLDEDGRGLRGARAARYGSAQSPADDALESPGELLEVLWDCASSKSDGLTQVFGVAPGEDVSLAVGAPGRTPRRVVVRATHALEPVDVRLEVEPALQLAFRDAATGQPIDGLLVQVGVGSRWSWDRSPWITVEAGSAAGRFDVRDPARRELRIDASAPGLGVRRLTLAGDATREELHTFELAGPRRVVLRVVDETGAPREDVRIASRIGSGADLHTRVALEREPGSYVLAGLEPGEYRLEFSAEDAVRVKRRVSVGDAAVLDLGVIAQPSYGGIDLLVLGGDGLPAGGLPAAAFVGDGAAPGPQLLELGDGQVSLRRLQPGPWELTMVPGGRLLVEVPPGAPVAATLPLEPWSILRGEVLRAGEPVAGHVVVLDAARLAELPSLLPSAPLEMGGGDFACREVQEVGADGRFAFALERYDDVAVVAVDARGNASAAQHLSTRPGDLHELRLELPAADAVLEGVARDLVTGLPAPGASIVVGGVIVERTDADGRFRVDGLHARRVDVMALPTVFQQQRLPVSVELVAGQAVRVDLDVPEDDMSGLICFY